MDLDPGLFNDDDNGDAAPDDSARDFLDLPIREEGGVSGNFLQYLGPPRIIRADNRTRASKLAAEAAAWGAQMPQLVTAFLKWKHTGDNAPCSTEDVPPLGQSVFTVHIGAVHLFSFDFGVPVTVCDGEGVNTALLHVGLLGCSPTAPTIAISLRILELYHRLRRRSPSFGIQPFVKALCDMHERPYHSYLRIQFSAAFDIYLDILRHVQEQVSVALGRNTPNWRVLNSCPPCRYVLKDEPELPISVLWSSDGNMSARRCASAGTADSRVFQSDYHIPPEQVDVFKDEVKRRVQKPPVGQPSSKDDPWVEINEPGEPGDGAGDSKPSICTERWRNAKADHFKTASDVFDQKGIFLGACRHALILWFMEMIRSGELAKYPLALVKAALDVGPPNQNDGFDIGCAFAGTLERSSLGPRARAMGFHMSLNAFHGYGHGRLCQTKWHPLYKRGFGLEDLETCERVFSASNSVALVIRHASYFRWLQFLDLHFKQWDEDKYAELSRFILNNYKQALAIIGENTPIVEKFMSENNWTGATIEGWLTEERNYLENLLSEPPEDLLAIGYVEALQTLEKAMAAWTATCSTFADGFRHLGPVDVSTSRRAQADIVTTNRLETARRTAYDKYIAALNTVEVFESALDTARWEQDSTEYRKALELISTRNYRRALDKLELLMVQRMFELSRAHVAGIGYKLRQSISKGIQARSKAIRTAVTNYNVAAAALTPPGPMVTFDKLLEWTHLQEFDLLRHARQDIRDKPWANPVNREMASRYHKIQRAKEEITRCNIEARRLLTHIHDEEEDFRQVLERLEADSEQVLLAHELREVLYRRTQVNTVHLANLHNLHKLPGYTGWVDVGQRIGRVNSTSPRTLLSSRSDGADDNHEAGAEDGSDGDEDAEGLLAGVEDFVVRLQADDT